jgi:hypothetical protein
MSAGRPQGRREGADRNPSDPLTHPLRRRLVRYLHRSGEPRGPHEASTAFNATLSLIAYHMKVLADFGTITEASSAPNEDPPLYESAVGGNPEVLSLLEATEEEDEGRRAA